MPSKPAPWIFNDKATELWTIADYAIADMIEASTREERLAIRPKLIKALISIMEMIPEQPETPTPKATRKRGGPTNG
jgi:hypothetical protein